MLVSVLFISEIIVQSLLYHPYNHPGKTGLKDYLNLYAVIVIHAELLRLFILVIM